MAFAIVSKVFQKEKRQRKISENPLASKWIRNVSCFIIILFFSDDDYFIFLKSAFI